MRIVRVLCVLSVALLATGCACRTRQVVGPSDETNIARVQPGQELRDINFGFDSSELNEVARAILRENAQWLSANSDATVQIEGHADERGTIEYNRALGMRRAQSAYDYLRSLGIAANRMSTVSYGEELPLDPRHNEEAWARNRRVHFDVQ